MIERELNSKIDQTMTRFENLGNLLPDDDWNRELMGRLDEPFSRKRERFVVSSYTAAVLLLVLLNIGFVLVSLKGNTSERKPQKSEMQVISRELLINPSSINN